MNQFEKDYYESDVFWQGEMLQDAANIERFKLTEDIIPLEVRTLIDVGCGNGVFVNRLSKNRPYLDIYGLDRSKKALEYVNTRKSQGEITEIPFEDKYFDCVTCLEVIEHLTIPDYSRGLSELARVSKKYIVISVPYAESLEQSFTQCPSCKSKFNTELHLRSFDDNAFKTLLDEWGFQNVATKKLGKSVSYKYHSTFRKIFYPEQFLSWTSPICPLCGYTESKTEKIRPNEGTINKPKRKWVSYFTRIPKLFWPKEQRYYWILGLFERIEK